LKNSIIFPVAVVTGGGALAMRQQKRKTGIVLGVVSLPRQGQEGVSQEK